MHCAAFAFSTLSPSPITTAGEAAASSRLLHGRGKGHRHSIQCCPQGCGGSCNGGGGGSSVSAYAFISSQADLSIAKSVIDETGLKTLLEGPFANTLFVPNNAVSYFFAESSPGVCVCSVFVHITKRKHEQQTRQLQQRHCRCNT